MLTDRDLIRMISAGLGAIPSHIEKIIHTAALRYKVFEIPKRNGNMRKIAQPARELKSIQRWLVGKLTNDLPVHDAVTAYQPGCSIKDHALRHADSNYLLKMDFRNFFPSIKSVDIFQHIRKYCQETYDDRAIKLICRACTWTAMREPPYRLCIGAPSSPLLSNSVMFDFDVLMHEYSCGHGLTYSRYADDLAFSAMNFSDIKGVEAYVVEVLNRIAYPKISLNTEKTVYVSRAGRRTLTGITLTPDKTVSVGRERKRLIRAMYHQNMMGLLAEDEQLRLNGLIAFVESIEPGFSKRLGKKYRKG